MMQPRFLLFFLAGAIATLPVQAESIYLKAPQISVEVGPGTAPGSFNNTFSGGETIEKAIDAPSAEAEEFHTQITHIWHSSNVAGGGLELLFDFGQRYDITTLHFWNYTEERYDVDEVTFEFFDENDTSVGTLKVSPALGSNPGIRAENIALAAPLGVRRVRALLVGSNGQVDFQNIGFTATPSAPVQVRIPPLILPGSSSGPAAHISD